MSTFRVEAVEIGAVGPHPNADRLELAAIKGRSCVVQKGRYRAGDLAIYIPIDSILPPNLEAMLFPLESKVRLHNSRVRTIKLRGAISQGMIVDPLTLSLSHVEAGMDVTEELGIKKYEPPVHLSSQSGSAQASKKQCNPNFRKYTGIENAKNYPEVFAAGEEVSVTEKIHGTNFRAGWVPFYADTLWKRLKQFLRLAPSHEFVFGSHNVQLQSRLLHKGFYNTNVYAEAVAKYALRWYLNPGEVVYGEVYGDGIQKGYTYGCKTGERKLVVFDLMRDGHWLDAVAFKHWADENKLPTAPILYQGPFDLAKIKALTLGDSVLDHTQKVREGVVVKPLKETVTYIGRKVLKFISDEYLLKDQTDFH